MPFLLAGSALDVWILRPIRSGRSAADFLR